MSLEEFGYRQELRRALTTKDLLIYGMVFMVPIAPYSCGRRRTAWCRSLT
jgi:hypothetical protein